MTIKSDISPLIRDVTLPDISIWIYAKKGSV